MKLGRKTFLGDRSTQAVQLGGSNQLKQQRNRAYWLIALLLLVMTGLASAVTVLAKIHTVIPVVSVIDANGHVVKQQVVSQETITGQEAFVQSQVYDFIMYCNTFDPDWRQRFADLCRLHSTPAVAAQYDTETSADNPHNPFYQMGPGGRRSPRSRASRPWARMPTRWLSSRLQRKRAVRRRLITTRHSFATPSRSNPSRWAIDGKTHWATRRPPTARIKS